MRKAPPKKIAPSKMAGPPIELAPIGVQMKANYRAAQQRGAQAAQAVKNRGNQAVKNMKSHVKKKP